MKSIVPVVMAGVLGIYGLIIAVIISTGSEWQRSARAPACCPPQMPSSRPPWRTLPPACPLFNPRSAPAPRLTLPPVALPTPAVNQTAEKAYYLFDGYAHFASGLACGLAGLGAGMAIGIVGDAGVRCAGSGVGLQLGRCPRVGVGKGCLGCRVV